MVAPLVKSTRHDMIPLEFPMSEWASVNRAVAGPPQSAAPSPYPTVAVSPCSCPNVSDEAWRRLSQVLENIVASNVDATVKLYSLFSVLNVA